MKTPAAVPVWRLTERGWIAGVRRRPSPNQDARPPGTTVDLLVVHAISLPPGRFGGPHVDRLFRNSLDPKLHPCFTELQGLRVSAHLLIARDGTLTQYVSLHRRAWHAGASSFAGRPRCNDYSIGVELEGAPEVPYEQAQYRCLAELSRFLLRACPGLTPERVAGHCHVAPGRKQDPYEHFDWAWYRAQLCAPGTGAGAAPAPGAAARHGEPDRI